MDYIDGICDAPMDAQESQNEAAAAHQMALDVLYRIGCQYNVSLADIAALCQIAGIDLYELNNYSGTPAAC